MVWRLLPLLSQLKERKYLHYTNKHIRLGLQLELEDLKSNLKCFSYNLKTYNNKRSWNNSEGWANPENFDKYRW